MASTPTVPSLSGNIPCQVNWRYLLPICLVATLGGLLFGYDTGVISGAIEPLTARFDLGCHEGLGVRLRADRLRGGRAAGRAALGPVRAQAGDVPGGGDVPGLRHRHGAARTTSATFIVFRFLGGVGIGIASISTPMYIAEITPADMRGRMVAVNQIAIVGGIAADLVHQLLHRHAAATRRG